MPALILNTKKSDLFFILDMFFDDLSYFIRMTKHSYSSHFPKFIDCFKVNIPHRECQFLAAREICNYIAFFLVGGENVYRHIGFHGLRSCI